MGQRRANESPEARQRRLSYGREYRRKHRERDHEKRALYQRDYQQRLNSGEIQLPRLDWAICARGGSDAQAKAHYRRGEKPCDNCRAAMNRACQRRTERFQARKLKGAS